MTIEVTYNVTDIYISSEVSPIYIDVNYQTSGGGAAVWGGITGTLSNQTDLQTALDLKLDESTIDGGSEGQILTKNSATDFDFAWIDNYAKYMATNVRNQTGSTIDSFKVVYISGATGNKPLITLSDADTEVTSSKTYGVTKQSIANNGTGDVVTAGELSGIDTSAFAEGDRLWLSSTPGGVVTSPPAEPAHSVFIGTVIRSHPTLGIVDVNIQNGYELTELHGVQITSETNNQGLFYDGTSSLWVNKSIPTVLGYTPEQPLTFSSPLSRLVNAVSIPAATSSVNGYLSSMDWSTFNGKENALTFSSPLSRSTNTISIPQATSSVSGFLSSTDWSTFNSKQGALTLTTTGTSGAATLVGNTLNIPQYSGGGGGGMAIGGSITSATAGSVLFAGTSGVLAQNNANFFWDNTNSRLGIGTNAPDNALTININSNSGNGLKVTNTNTGNLSRAYVALYNNSGNAAALSIWGTGTSFPNKTIFESTKDFIIATDTGVASGGTSKFQIAVGGYNAVSTPQLSFHATGNLSLNTTTDAGFRLDVNGTSRVQSALTVNDNITFTISSTKSIGWGGNTSLNAANPLIYSDNNFLAINSKAGSRLYFNYDNANALSIIDFFNGKTTFGLSGTIDTTGNITITKNINSNANLNIINTVSGTGSSAQCAFTSDNSSGTAGFGKYSTTTNSNKIVASKDAYFYNGITGGDIAILNDFSTGSIKMAAGGSSTAHMTIKSNGRINMSSLPTSSAGLSAGDLWNNGGVINIV